MYRSRLLKIAAQFPARMDGVVRESAERIAEGARDRVPVGSTGRLRDSIHIEREGAGEYWVRAGDAEVFYGMLVEHGTVHTPARPFLMPAAEEARPSIQAIGMAALRKL